MRLFLKTSYVFKQKKKKKKKKRISDPKNEEGLPQKNLFFFFFGFSFAILCFHSPPPKITVNVTKKRQSAPTGACVNLLGL